MTYSCITNCHGVTEWKYKIYFKYFVRIVFSNKKCISISWFLQQLLFLNKIWARIRKIIIWQIFLSCASFVKIIFPLLHHLLSKTLLCLLSVLELKSWLVILNIRNILNPSLLCCYFLNNAIKFKYIIYVNNCILELVSAFNYRTFIQRLLFRYYLLVD